MAAKNRSIFTNINIREKTKIIKKLKIFISKSIHMPAKSEKQRRFFYLVKAVQKGKVSGKRVGGKVAKAAKSMSPQDVEDFTHGKNLPKKKVEEMISTLKDLMADRRPGIDPRVDLRYTHTTDSGTGGTPIEPTYLEEDSTLPPDDLGRNGVAVPGANYLDEDERDLNYILNVWKDTSGNLIDPHYTNENGEETSDTLEVNPIAKTFKQKGDFEQYVGRFSGLEIKPKEYESIINYANAKPSKQDKFSVRYEDTDEFGNNTITVIKKLREGNDLVFTAFQTTIPQTPPEGGEAPESEIIVNKSRSFRNEIDGGAVLSDILNKLEV